jgi:hypothetical protein
MQADAPQQLQAGPKLQAARLPAQCRGQRVSQWKVKRSSDVAAPKAQRRAALRPQQALAQAPQEPADAPALW